MKIVVKPRIKIKESDIQSTIRDYLRLRGYYVMRHQQGLGCFKGLSDLTAIKDGITIYVEVKVPRGVQSDWQLEFERQIREHGGIYVLARSVDDVIKVIGG